MVIPILITLDGEESKQRSKAQNKWRQKQLDIFYRTGKPIFRVTLETIHIRSNNNPNHFVEKKRWET
tara:strand:- start:99 stop:299 length:201 start_codon:yes stop_codon:yes gene_type:complete